MGIHVALDGEFIIIADILFVTDNALLAGALRGRRCFLTLRLASNEVPVQDADISRCADLARLSLVLAESQIAVDVDHTTFTESGLADALGHGFVAGAVVKRGILLRSELLIDSNSKRAELTVVFARFELRLIDDASFQVQICE